MPRPPPADAVKVLARNRRARFDYHLEETIEAGLVLRGSEVKSLREGRATLAESWAEVRGDELWLVGCHVGEYAFAGVFNHPPLRERKLLLHRREIDKLIARVARGGYTLVPLELYSRRGRIKVSLALARGKRQYDKRATERARAADRDAQEALRRR
jgi:SsrA-binding protein